ncbi:MAG: hypothetical protein V1647_03190 [Pseudomonadota bacterium]
MTRAITLFIFLFSVTVSASDYNDGLDAMRGRDYEKAIDRFTASLDKDVIKGIVTEAKVKEQLNKAKAAYFNELNIQISGYDKEKKYNDALSSVEDGLSVIPDDGRLLKMKADYEAKIKDIDAKVKQGEILLDNKNWHEAYLYFQKLRPYEDTNGSISSDYRRAKDEIINSYVTQGETYEKNYDFISAKKEYEKALPYDPKDEDIIDKIKAVKERIIAQEMLGQAKTLADQGQKEKALDILKAAYEKDDGNKEIAAQKDILRDEVALLWLNKAEDMESKEKYQDAYIAINKAENLEPDAKDVRDGIKTIKQSIILNFAKYLSDKASKFKSDEEAYIYYVASYSLNSGDKNVSQKIDALEQTIKDKACYNLGLKTTVSSKTKLSGDTLGTIDNGIKSELAGFAKDRCINVSDFSNSDQGRLTNTVLVYKIETKGATLIGKLDAESQAVDMVTGKRLAAARKMELFTGEAVKNTDTNVEKYLIDSVVGELVSEIKDSNLKYYSDRYYWMFSNAKDAGSKTTNAVLTFINKRRLSDEDLYTDTVVKYILKTYSVNIYRKELEITDNIRL